MESLKLLSKLMMKWSAERNTECSQALCESISAREKGEHEAAEENNSLRQACESLRGSLRAKQHENTELQRKLEHLQQELSDSVKRNHTLVCTFEHGLHSN
jgi:regulator of replication initiation timing